VARQCLLLHAVPSMNRLNPVLLLLLCLLPVPAEAQAQVQVQHAGRTDSTLPSLNAARPGERVVSTRPQRDAGEAVLRQELLRQAELDRLFNLRPMDGGMAPPVYPTIVLQPGADRALCNGGDCTRPRPQPLPLRPR